MDRSIRQRAKKVSAGGYKYIEPPPRRSSAQKKGGEAGIDDQEPLLSSYDVTERILQYVDGETEDRTVNFTKEQFANAVSTIDFTKPKGKKTYFRSIYLANRLKSELKPSKLTNSDIIQILIDFGNDLKNVYAKITQIEYDELITYAKTKRITRVDFDIAFNDYRENAINVQNFENLSAKFRIKWSPKKTDLINGLVNMQNPNTSYGTVDQKTKAFQYAIKKGIQKSEFDDYVQTSTNALTTLQWPLELTPLQRAVKCVGNACKTLTGGGDRV